MNPEKEEQIRRDVELEMYHSYASDTIMRWFRRHYEDPAVNTPFDSREGGYIYIWGGPYEAREVIYEQFGDEFSEEILDSIADDLETECAEWAKIPTLEDLDLPTEGVDYYERCTTSLANVSEQIDKAEASHNTEFINALLYAHCFTIMEAYLQDAFFSFIKEFNGIRRRFVETDPVIREARISLSEVFVAMESLDERIAERIQSVVFHRLHVVHNMYKDTLGISLPEGMKPIYSALQRRHDIIHRNCRDKHGNAFIIKKEDVQQLRTDIATFINQLHDILEEMRSNNPRISSDCEAVGD